MIASTAQYTGYKNRFFNACMRVAQRATSATVTAGTTVPTSSTGYPCVDRWFVYSTGANVTAAQVAGSSTTQNRLQITGAASVTAVGVGQRIEANNSYDLNGQTVTLSVDMANSVLTSVTWTANYATTANTFGTIGTPTKTQIATGTFTINSTVTQYAVQIAIPAAATTGIEILFTVGAQTSGTWTIGNPQIELGASATSFDYRPYGTELALCQRYFEKSYDIETALGTSTTNSSIRFRAPSTSVEWPLNFSVKKRTAPTVTLYSTTGASGNIRDISTGTDVAGGTTSIGQSWCFPFKSTAGTDGNQYGFHYAASAEL
jgi:hypothetical protein